MSRKLSIITLWAWIGLIISVAGCATSPWNQEQADIHMNIGNAYIQSGKYNSALKELLQAEKLGKPNPRVHYSLAVSYYYGKGLNQLAIAELKKAVNLDADYSEAYNFLGVIYSSMEKWDQAIEAFEKALSNILYDTPAYAHYNMGWAYYKKGDYGSALKQYELALVQDPDTVDLPLLEKNMGIVLLAQGRTADALKHLQKSIALMPSLAESHYWLGRCYIEQKNLEKAEAAFQQVMKLAPDTEWAEKSRGKIEELSALK